MLLAKNRNRSDCKIWVVHIKARQQAHRHRWPTVSMATMHQHNPLLRRWYIAPCRLAWSLFVFYLAKINKWVRQLWRVACSNTSIRNLKIWSCLLATAVCLRQSMKGAGSQRFNGFYPSRPPISWEQFHRLQDSTLNGKYNFQLQGLHFIWRETDC